jgi:hypothetical protein
MDVHPLLLVLMSRGGKLGLFFFPRRRLCRRGAAVHWPALLFLVYLDPLPLPIVLCHNVSRVSAKQGIFSTIFRRDGEHVHTGGIYDAPSLVQQG